MAAEYLCDWHATLDVLREQVEFLIDQKERGLASQSELKRLDRIRLIAIEPFYDPQ